MSSIENNTTRGTFFPGGPRTNIKTKGSPSAPDSLFKRNTDERRDQLEGLSKEDVKVNIPDAVKDFARIKKVVDAAPEIDNSQKIADLKRRIDEGTYSVDYEALADKILTSEF